MEVSEFLQKGFSHRYSYTEVQLFLSQLFKTLWKVCTTGGFVLRCLGEHNETSHLLPLLVSSFNLDQHH